jgi:hypothetical protein
MLVDGHTMTIDAVIFDWGGTLLAFPRPCPLFTLSLSAGGERSTQLLAYGSPQGFEIVEGTAPGDLRNRELLGASSSGPCSFADSLYDAARRSPGDGGAL